MQTQNTLQVLRWLSDQEDVQVAICGWTTVSTEGALRHILNGSTHTYRIKPSTVTINGVELEDDRIKYGELRIGMEYFCEELFQESFAGYYYHDEDAPYEIAVERGLLHHTREGAIAFCKARLGIKD